LSVPRSRPKLVVRDARESDEEALAEFRCSTGPWFEDEVERHIRDQALARALERDVFGYRLRLLEEGERLCAVGAHQPEELMLATGPITATRLVVLALALEYQGSVTATGARYADLALTALMFHALVREGLFRGVGVLTSLVAVDNIRSQRLCRRVGLTSETLASPRYMRMTGRFTLSGRHVASA
jgi:hypothetical protein